MSQLSDLMSGSVAPSEPVATPVDATAGNPYSGLSCETMSFSSANNQLLSSMIAANADDTAGLGRQSTELTFSDLTPPVPNVSTLESTRMLAVDASLPTVDGVSDAVPEPKSVLIRQMSSISAEAPTIEIPTDEAMVPSMAPKDSQTLMAGVADTQYSNMFQPVINGPSGSAPQTPADSPIGPMEAAVPTVMPKEPIPSNGETQPMPVLTAYEPSTTSFESTTADVYHNVAMSQMVPVLSNTTVAQVAVPSDVGPLPALGIEPALQEQLLDAIPPPSVNFPPGPVPMDEKGIPSALPGEFPLSLLPVEEEKVGGIESASVPLDKIEATINMNAKPVPTLTDAISVTQSEVNLIKSLPQEPQQSAAVIQTASQGEEVAQEQQFGLTYANQMQASADQSVIYQNAALSQVATPDQMTLQASTVTQPQPTATAQQTPPPITSNQIDPSHTIQTLTPLQPQQPSQAVLTDSVQQVSQSIGSTSLVNVPEGQLPPPPAPPSATSIGMFETNPNAMMSEMVTQSQLSNVLPPPPPLQPVQTNQIAEMNTLTNLVPVVEQTDPSLQTCRPSMPSLPSVVVKSEPQAYADAESPNTSVGLNKVNDDNNNPIHNSSSREPKEPTVPVINPQPLVSQMRGFPLCVISTTPTTYVSKNKTPIVTPKYELTLPPKKAKYASAAGLVVSNAKPVSSTHAVPSSGVVYDLPHNAVDHSSNMTPPFTSVSPILLSNLMPSVSVIDGPLSLVKDEKMRQLITATHPDYPAISGLLSFISPYHKPMTTSPMTTGHLGHDTPLSLSIKTSLNQSPSVTANSLSHSPHPSSHVPSLTRPSPHLNQSITSVSTIVHSQPTAVPVSVVTSVVDHNRAFPQRLKAVTPNNSATKANNKIGGEQHPTGPAGVKLQLAPLLSGDPAKPFQCALCGKHLASKNVYQLHLRSHSGEKPFTCNLCGHSFSQKTSLTRHMRSHTGERPFPCQVCGKRFADKERIKIHMRTHTGEKPFACDICGKQFSQKSTVKRHMSVHTGEKPFKCETCGKGFANRGNLTAHTKTHSNS